MCKKNFRQTSELLRELEDEQKSQEMLVRIVGNSQIVAIDTQDIKKVLSCGSDVIICEGYGDHARIALDEALRPAQAHHINLSHVNAVLVYATIRTDRFDYTKNMEAFDAFNSFFDTLPQAIVVWGLSTDTEQQQTFKFTLWLVPN